MLFTITGPVCYMCSDVSEPGSCQTLQRCADDEVCFSEKRLTGDLQEKFTFSCEKTMACDIGSKFATSLVGKKRNVKVLPEVDRSRREVTMCSMCCRESYCNKGICTTGDNKPIPATQEVYVRLITQGSAYEGTVQVYHNGMWGSICDDHWTNMDAQVVCRMLGYSPVGAVGMQGGVYTNSSGRIWLDEVTCNGQEASLAQCTKNAWGISDCTHSEDAGVVCSSDDIIFLLDVGLGGLMMRMNLMTQSFVPLPQLKIYTPTSFDYDPEFGRLYFVDPGLRQIVSIRFDGEDPREVRQLDINPRKVNVASDIAGDGFCLRKFRKDRTGPLNRKAQQDRVNGSQRRRPTGVLRDEGAHFYAISVFENFIYYTDWNENTVMRVNKDGTGRTNVGPPSFRQLSDIRIYSSAENLPGVTAATPVELDRDHVFVRLNSNGHQTATSGYVEVYANGEYGTICDDNWDDRDAAVVCRMLGFSESGAVAITNGRSGHGSFIIAMDEVNCRGTESHLVDCGITRDNWAHHDCSHNEDAGVSCTVDNTVNDFLLFTDSSTSTNAFINRMDMTTYSYVALQIMNAPNPVALTFNPADRRVYFSSVHQVPGSQIFSSLLDATGQRMVKQMPLGSVIDGLAVDSHMGKLYYTDTGRDVIASCNLDGSNEQIIIERANFDGSGRRVLVSTNLKWPNGLVLDKTNGLLYFCDAGTHLIESMDTNGQHRNVLFSDFGARFFGLAASRHHIYYSDWNRITPMRINKDGSNQMPVGPDSFSRIGAIAVSES
ncbi:hypothetical protein C0Q70_17990 [Pomacea canaliculata]|uniref:SRCR domain-containing protein n=1 Tax=Pomacea canaliculata TaxID=400727 RepID=A0A2T7NLZ4_POMCA|nr:hypothetical protein C0Q70_17990 [Pomacea canaliculata]